MKKTKFLRKNFLNAPRGITLMVLIITIIIMLILAGIVLNLGIGDDGIFSSAEKAVSETTIAMAREESELMLAKWVIKYHKEGVAGQTAAEYVEENLGEGATTSSGKFFVEIVDEDLVVVYEGTEANSKNKVTIGKMGNSGGVEWMEFPDIPSELNVGDYVTYSPSGTYNWAAEYASSDLAPGDDDVLLSSASGGKFKITSWRVFSINEITGKVELVPSSQTTGKVRLQGAQGYNNAVKLLNDACSGLYGDSSKGIAARSINMEDIEGAMTEEALAAAHSYENTSNSNLKWGEQTSSAYTIYKHYPTIYAKENLSVINGTKNAERLGISSQNVLIGRTDEGATDGKLVASTSIQPYQTYWKCDNEFMQTAFKGDGYNLLISGDAGTNYWVASRCVHAYSSTCDFGVRGINGGYVGGNSMCYAKGHDSYEARALFPVVSLNVNLIAGNDTDGWKVE